MRRRYSDCTQAGGNCTSCSLVNYGRDCHNRPIVPLAWARMAAEMDQPTLAAKSEVNIRQIQKVESGEIDAGNLTARNLLALADALGVDPHDLITEVRS